MSDISLKKYCCSQTLHSVNRAHYHLSPPLSKTKELLKIAAIPPTSSKNFTWKGHQLKHNKRLASTKLKASKF